VTEPPSKKIQQKLDALPARTGVYLFKDRRGEVLYIGKAVNLRNRVRSYFHSGRRIEPKTRRMVARAHDFESIVTDSEVEALILEANLVKEYKPRYNINLKDDKSFPYIRITSEPFPRIFPTRKRVRDGSRYFGPYTDAAGLRDLLRAVRRIFPIRSCNLPLDESTIGAGKYKVCLNYQIQRCTGPCEGHISAAEYNRTIEMVADFIRGRTARVESEIRKRMDRLVAELNFEQAARLRDQLRSIQMFRQRQKVYDQSLADRDLVAVAAEQKDACCVLFKMRDGKIISRQHFYMRGTEDEELRDITLAFLKQYYLRADEIPGEIWIPIDLGDEKDALRLWLQRKRGSRLLLHHPQRGEKAHLLKMCQRNARLLLDELLLGAKSARRAAGSVTALAKALQLENAPMRIEAFDISNIQGAHPVASMVCFVNGRPKKSDYRRFRIRVKSTPDDYAMMREAVSRRYRRLLDENRAMPDLVLVDGGVGQLSAARRALSDLNLTNIPLVALAKRVDEVFLPGHPEAQNIRRDSPALRLLQRIRDEAHRFAVTYHRSLRLKGTLRSALEAVPGVGPKRRDLLLNYFGSMANIRTASLEQLSAVPGLPKDMARKIHRFFHPNV